MALNNVSNRAYTQIDIYLTFICHITPLTFCENIT